MEIQTFQIYQSSHKPQKKPEKSSSNELSNLELKERTDSNLSLRDNDDGDYSVDKADFDDDIDEEGARSHVSDMERNPRESCQKRRQRRNDPPFISHTRSSDSRKQISEEDKKLLIVSDESINLLHFEDEEESQIEASYSQSNMSSQRKISNRKESESEKIIRILQGQLSKDKNINVYDASSSGNFESFSNKCSPVYSTDLEKIQIIDTLPMDYGITFP